MLLLAESVRNLVCTLDKVVVSKDITGAVVPVVNKGKLAVTPVTLTFIKFLRVALSDISFAKLFAMLVILVLIAFL